MEDLIVNVDNFLAVVVSVLVALQMVVNYFLSPEKAEKFNVIGKVLDFLVKTRAGISPKKDGSIK